MSPASSADSKEDEIPPVGSPHVISQPSDDRPVTLPPETRRETNLESSKGNVVKRWLQTKLKKSNEDRASRRPDLVSRKSRDPVSRRSPSHSPPRVDAINEGPSRMAAGRRKAVSVRP